MEMYLHQFTSKHNITLSMARMLLQKHARAMEVQGTPFRFIYEKVGIISKKKERIAYCPFCFKEHEKKNEKRVEEGLEPLPYNYGSFNKESDILLHMMMDKKHHLPLEEALQSAYQNEEGMDILIALMS